MIEGKRILELGHHCLFKRVIPDQTLWVGTGDWIQLEKALGGLRFSKELFQTIQNDVRDGHFDLIVCHVPSLRKPRGAIRSAWTTISRRIHGKVNRKVFLEHVLNLSREAPLMFLDFEDHAWIPPGFLPLLDSGTFYFKREFVSDSSRLFPYVKATDGNTHPLESDIFSRRLAKFKPVSIGLSRERIEALPPTPTKKIFDILFAGTIHSKNQVRQAGVILLKKLKEKGFLVEITNQLPLKDYMNKCAQSWLVWSPEGLGTDCFRHYEALACGSVPLINRTDVKRYAPLIQGTHCFYYDASDNDLEGVAIGALQDKSRLLKMAETGKQHVLRYHTHRGICEYIASFYP